MEICKNCGRADATGKGVCLTCIPNQEEPEIIEHRSSRALDRDIVREAPREPIDRMFKEAADAGFKPLTPEEAAAFHEKLRGASAAIRGARR